MKFVRQAITVAKARVAAALGRVFSLVASALTWFLMLAFSGLAMIVAGIFVIAGLGWALIAGGVASLALAFFVQKGMTNG